LRRIALVALGLVLAYGVWQYVSSAQGLEPTLTANQVAELNEVLREVPIPTDARLTSVDAAEDYLRYHFQLPATKIVKVDSFYSNVEPIAQVMQRNNWEGRLRGDAGFYALSKQNWEVSLRSSKSGRILVVVSYVNARN